MHYSRLDMLRDSMEYLQGLEAVPDFSWSSGAWGTCPPEHSFLMKSGAGALSAANCSTLQKAATRY